MDVDQWCDEDARKAAHQPTRDERQGTHQRHVDPYRQRTVDVDRGRQHRLADPRITVEQLQGEDDQRADHDQPYRVHADGSVKHVHGGVAPNAVEHVRVASEIEQHRGGRCKSPAQRHQ